MFPMESLDSQENLVIASARHRSSSWVDSDRCVRLSPMENQVGGFGMKKSPMIRMQPHYILKPLVTKENRGFREVLFYELIQISSLPKDEWKNKLTRMLYRTDNIPLVDRISYSIFWMDPIVVKSKQIVQESWKTIKCKLEFLRRLINFTAPYYGMVESATIHSDIFLTEARYIVLHDITSTFQHPCILYLKIGTQTFEPNCSREKQEKEWNKYGVHQQKFGIRIVGMRKYDPWHPDADNKGYRYWGKAFGRSLTTRTELRDALRTYFLRHDDTTSLRMDVISHIESQVSELHTIFQTNSSLAFYSSSILMVYDGALDWNDATIRMIDFCHVRSQPGGDVGYQFGLQTLSSLLRDLQTNS